LTDEEAVGALDGALARVAGVRRLLVALDFDGTAAYLVDDPMTAYPVSDVRDAVRGLSALADTTVAYVSGRPLVDLATLTAAGERVLLVGSHGAETSFEDQGPLELSGDERRRLSGLGDALDAVRVRFPAARLEHKPAGMGVHTRGLETHLSRAIFEAARVAASAAGDYAVREGKEILEFAVRNDTKADAIRRLRLRTGADAVFFAGDDVTDEDGFAALTAGDVSVKVGPGETAAAFRVADPDELGRTVQALADLRAASRA
jgi:trehalose 6-phosphate phosphatase